MTESTSTMTGPPAAKTNLMPFLDLKAQYAPIRQELLAAVTRVMDSQHFILGPEVEILEKELAQYVGCEFTIACASGSDALLLSLMAFDLHPGDEVITTPFTFIATGGAIARLDLRPVFVDIDPQTYNLDPGLIEKAITPKTRAIIPVHLFGLAAEMEPILAVAGAHGLKVIEDAAQAISATYRGTSVGALGDCGCFSFFPSKNLGGAGDGGLITTNDPNLADRLKVLRVHGSRKKYIYEAVGVNSRLDTLQAAILRVKLKHLDEWTQARILNARRYRSLFTEHGLEGKITLPHIPADCVHAFNQFVIRNRERDALRDYLRQAGIPSEIYYPMPLHLQPAFSYLGYPAGDLPQAEQASREVLALPVYPELNQQQQKLIVSTIADFYKHRA
jgi:dTDP-4-amino-4,6-dideoxygalactose transaminase